MTPLAHRIVRELTLPPKRRTFRDHAALLENFRQEFHCFEVTAVMDLSLRLAREARRNAFPSVEWAFLPAKRTWIEWDEGCSRVGALLCRSGDFANVIIASGKDFGAVVVGKMALRDQLMRVAADVDSTMFHVPRPHVMPYRDAFDLMWWLYGFLLIINSPKVVGRTLHNPHRGLARKLSRSNGAQGRFPLQAWTEILLRAETINESGEPDVVTGLTHQVCLHWVRAHKQRYNGVWTLVGDYWRGDGSLGIKQSRYRLVPGREGSRLSLTSE